MFLLLLGSALLIAGGHAAKCSVKSGDMSARWQVVDGELTLEMTTENMGNNEWSAVGFGPDMRPASGGIPCRRQQAERRHRLHPGLRSSGSRREALGDPAVRQLQQQHSRGPFRPSSRLFVGMLHVEFRQQRYHRGRRARLPQLAAAFRRDLRQQVPQEDLPLTCCHLFTNIRDSFLPFLDNFFPICLNKNEVKSMSFQFYTAQPLVGGSISSFGNPAVQVTDVCPLDCTGVFTTRDVATDPVPQAAIYNNRISNRFNMLFDPTGASRKK